MNPAWNARSKDFNDNAFRFKFHFAPLVFIHLHGNVAVGHPEISSTCVREVAWGTGAQCILIGTYCTVAETFKDLDYLKELDIGPIF